MLQNDESIYMLTAVLSVLVMIYYFFAAKHYSNNFINNIIEKENVLHTQHELIRRLGKASEYKDNETGMHIARMSYYCYLLAKESLCSDSFSKNILYASTMHDVGKIGIPDSILLKPGKLDKDEFETMKSHSEIGKKIL